MSLLYKCKTDEDVQRLLARCMRSTLVCGLTFWPEMLDSPICGAHRKLAEILDNPRPRQRVVIKGTRKGGKTTWLKLFVARCILFRLKRYIFYISQSESHAMSTTEAIKRMLIGNKLIRDLPEFGDIRERDAESVDREFSKKGWVATFPGDKGSFATLVVPRGSGQQVRGILFDHYTPDLVVVDDLEDKKLVSNENVRNANFDYVISDVGRCFSNTRDDWQLVYLDTHKHEDSVIARLFRMPSGWETHLMPLCDGEYRTLMHPYITQERVDELVREARENGTLDEFARECMCMSISSEAAKFRREYFQYYDEAELAEPGRIENIVLADPAKTTGDKSCRSAIVVWGLDLAAHRFYMRHIEKGRFHPAELIERFINLVLKYGAACCGVEVTGLDEFIRWPLQAEMVRRNVFTPIIWCKARGSKESRAGMLESIYKRGQVWHNRAVAHLVEPALLSYPRPAEWDVLDAAAYIFEVLEQGRRYFSPLAEPDDAQDALAFRELERGSLDPEFYESDGTPLWDAIGARFEL